MERVLFGTELASAEDLADLLRLAQQSHMPVKGGTAIPPCLRGNISAGFWCNGQAIELLDAV